MCKVYHRFWTMAKCLAWGCGVYWLYDCLPMERITPTVNDNVMLVLKMHVKKYGGEVS